MPPKLSYIMKLKVNKVLELKSKMDRTGRNRIISFIFFSIPVLWILAFTKHYTFSLENSGGFFPYVNTIDLLFLTVGLISAIWLYCLNQLYGKVKGKYDSLRGDIMDNIGPSICICHEQCNCKQEMIKYLNERGVDLVLR